MNMKIAVLYPQAAFESATLLAKKLGAAAINPFKSAKRDYKEYDLVINYGCNRNIKNQRRINKVNAIARCIDKFTTFSILAQHNIPVPRFAIEKVKAVEWPCVVVRKQRDGKMNEGMEYCFPEGRLHKLPDAPLYTEYYDHKKEFRVIVLKGKVVACYEKVLVGDEWEFHERTYRYLDAVKHQCLQAAHVLDIDYVGFDVLIADNNEFVILEANSAPIITDDVIKAFQKYIKQLEKELA